MKWFWSKKKKTDNEKLNNISDEMKQKLERIAALEEAEAKAATKHKIRHALYDTSKAVVGFFRGIFGKKVKKEEEIRNVGNRKMVRREEIFLGGTKPMSQYTADDGSKWLAKQAVNCMGYYKISGVLMTVAGANVQKLVDPHTAIDAYIGKTQEDGDISFQQKIENTISSKDIDLFKFSKHPELAFENDKEVVQGLGDQILREHVTDWLLCNFDTKGENFLVRYGNSGFELLGIDKEASFSKINDPEAQHMSSTYKPHANNTLYNAVFEMYRQGKMDLNLDVMKSKIDEIVKMDPDEYMNNFSDYLDHERKNNPAAYAETYMKIRERKQSLGEEYNKFFTALINDRMKAKPEEAQALRDRYFNGGTECKLFEPRDRSPKAQAGDIAARIREDCYARIATGQINPHNIALLVTSQGLQVKLEKGEYDNIAPGKMNRMFSTNSIQKTAKAFEEHPTVKGIMSALKKGDIDLSKIKSAVEFGKTIMPYFKASSAVMEEPVPRTEFEKDSINSVERATVDMM